MAEKPPPEYERAAELAAARVKDLLITMLVAREIGDVIVVVDWGYLTPQKRVITKAKGVKVARGQFVVVETVET